MEFVCGLLFLSGVALASETLPTGVIRSKPVILDFKIETFTASEERKSGVLKGHYKNDAPTLILANKRIMPNSDGLFSVTVPLSGEKTDIEITQIDDFGKVIHETLTLVLSADERKQTMLSLGLLYTVIAYKETGLPDLNETALTLKAGMSRSLSRSWEGTLGGYFTAVPIKNDQSTPARFAGVNLRLGFTPSPTARTKLTLFGGAYYTTMLVSGDAFGFHNMSGPQIFPVLTHEFGSQTQFSTYFKYSPVSKSFGEFSFGNREIAGGLAFTWKRQNAKTVSVGVDLADIKLTFLQAGQNITISSQSVSGGITLGW